MMLWPGAMADLQMVQVPANFAVMVIVVSSVSGRPSAAPPND
jgi:hypothetical protein